MTKVVLLSLFLFRLFPVFKNQKVNIDFFFIFFIFKLNFLIKFEKSKHLRNNNLKEEIGIVSKFLNVSCVG